MGSFSTARLDGVQGAVRALSCLELPTAWVQFEMGIAARLAVILVQATPNVSGYVGSRHLRAR
jgi:hypothetical protein